MSHIIIKIILVILFFHNVSYSQIITPESEYKVILNDLQALPPEVRLTTRYLTLYSMPQTYYKKATAVVSGVLNSLSWTQASIPELVPNTNGRIIRINISNYARNSSDLKRWHDAWEQAAMSEPYFLVPWVDRNDAIALYNETKSVGPILRADWFVVRSMLEDDPKTKDIVEGFYSKFLGLPKTESELFSMLYIRVKEIADSGSDRAGLTEISGTGSDAPRVANNNRKLVRYPASLTPHGGYLWVSYDTINSSDENRNYIKNPLSDFKDGGEYIFSLPNGMQGYYLTARNEKVVNGKKVVDFNQISEVPIAVASDSNFDHHIVKMYSCTYCHTNGINNFTDIYNELISPKPPGGLVAARAAKFEDAQRLKQLFYPDLKSYVLADRQNYANAVKTVSGLSTLEFSQAYKAVIDFYEKPVTSNQAAVEFGTLNLGNYLTDEIVSTTEGTLLLLRKGQPVHRDKFEAEYHNGKLLQEVKNNVLMKKDAAVNISLEVDATIIGTQVISNPVESLAWKIKYKGTIYGPYTLKLLNNHMSTGSILKTYEAQTVNNNGIVDDWTVLDKLLDKYKIK